MSTRAIGQWLLAPLTRQIVLMPVGTQIASVAVIPGPKLRILGLYDKEAPIERRILGLAPSGSKPTTGEPIAFPFMLPTGDWYSAFQTIDHEGRA